MKKILLILCFIVAFAFTFAAQAPFRIQGKCKAPNASTYGSITIESLGDIRVKPCPSRTTFFSGIVDLTGATVLGGGNMSGSGTVNFIPRFTAITTLGNTPSSWNGTLYRWNNTALNSDWTMDFTPTTGTGNFAVGDRTGGVRNYFEIDGAGAFSTWETDDIDIKANASFLVEGNNIALGQTPAAIEILNNANDRVTLGDAFGVGNQTRIRIDDTARTVALARPTIDDVSLVINNLADTFAATNLTGTVGFTFDTGSGNTTVASSNQLDITATLANIREGTASGAEFSGTDTILGDVGNTGTSGFLELTSTNVQLGAVAAGSVIVGGAGSSVRVNQATDTLASTLSIWDMSNALGGGFGVTNFLLNRTITAAGTVGARTINLPAGTVNFAAGAGVAGLVVTNSTVTANSIINVMARANDATCSVKNYVPTAGSFTIFMTANCTAETSVGFVVTN